MKTITLIAIFFSTFFTLQAQETHTTSSANKTDIKQIQHSKADFYTLLVATGGFDIQIKNNNTSSTYTKSDYYTTLVTQNNFNVANTHTVAATTKHTLGKTIYTVNTNAIINLVP